MPPLVSRGAAPRPSGLRAARASAARVLPFATVLVLAACDTRASSQPAQDQPQPTQPETALTEPSRSPSAAVERGPVAPESEPTASPDRAKAARRSEPLTPLAAAFDALVTAEAMFPDPTLRALYRVVPPETRDEQRVYGFELATQPGMEPARHFHLLSVAISAAKGPLDSSPTTLSGPDGAFNELAVRTSDGRYDVSVSEGKLLPDTVKLPAFELTRAARAIADRYAGPRARR